MIPVSKPSITYLEKKYVNQALDEGFISTGRFVEEFENKWSAYNKRRFGVACNSGTTAMHLALLALGVGPGDEVIVPEFTMAATAWAVTYTGATPVFVDCENDLNISVHKIKHKITKRTKVIMPVHVYGRRCQMELIMFLAKKHNLKVVEDMAEAHGIMPSGDIACYSFQGNKIITTGEGGMCITDDMKLANEMRRFSTLYFDKTRSLIHRKVGYNYKMTNVQAAIGCAQVERIEEILAKRKQIEAWYDSMLPERMRMPKRDVLWMYDINLGEFMEWAKEDLAKKGIETRYFFKPMSIQPMYRKGARNFNADLWSKRGIYLPTFTDMTKDVVEAVCTALLDVQK